MTNLVTLQKAKNRNYKEINLLMKQIMTNEKCAASFYSSAILSWPWGVIRQPFIKKKI